MAKKKTAAHGKRSAQKRSHQASPELDVLQERFNSMEIDFHQLAAVLGQQ